MIPEVAFQAQPTSSRLLGRLQAVGGVLESPGQVQVLGLESGQATRGEPGPAGNSDNRAIGFPMFLGRLDARLDAVASHTGGSRRMVALVRMALFHAHHSRQVAAGRGDSAVLAGNTRAGCPHQRVRRGSGDTHES